MLRCLLDGPGSQTFQKDQGSPLSDSRLPPSHPPARSHPPCAAMPSRAASHPGNPSSSQLRAFPSRSPRMATPPAPPATMLVRRSPPV